MTRRDAIGLGLSCAVAVVPYAYVNLARFGTLWSIPYSKQLEESLDPVRLHNLQLNGGSPFGLKFIPTTLRQYLRPDAVALHWGWPTFGAKPRPLFGVRLDGVAPTSSIVDSMLVFSVLALVGIVWLVRKTPEGRSKHILVIPVAAALVGSIATLSYSYLAQRYLVDFMPLIMLLGLIGLNAGIDWLRSSRPATRQLVCIGLAAIVAVNVWVSVGFARFGDHSRHVHDEVCVASAEHHTPHPHVGC